MSSDRYKPTTKMPALPELLGKTELSLFDQDNPDINLFNLVDEELIRLSGSELYYYKFLMDEEGYDEVYMENRSKAIISEPVTVFGHYDPTVLEEKLGEFGLEITNDQEFTFNKTYIEAKLRRALLAGDVIKPVFQNQKYEVHQVQEDSFDVYGVYHYRCSATLLRDSQETLDEPLTDRTDDIGSELEL